jgi:hypothetical protein
MHKRKALKVGTLEREHVWLLSRETKEVINNKRRKAITYRSNTFKIEN